MIYTVLSVREKKSARGGSLIYIELAAGDERKIYTLCEGTYREIGCPLSGDMISCEVISEIANDDMRQRAENKALSLLSFCDNSKSRLFMKLTRAGFSRESAEYAVCRMIEFGYLNEKKQLRSLIMKYVNGTSFGRRKILSKLLSLGYDRHAATEALNELSALGEVDFDLRRQDFIASLGDIPEAEIKKKLYFGGYDA